MKKIMSMLATAVFAVVAGVNVYNAQTTELAMSDLQMENIEALADDCCETGTVIIERICITSLPGCCEYENPHDEIDGKFWN